MHRILNEIEQWNSLSPERVEIKITDAVNNLKFDRVKRYESNLDAMGEMDADQIIAARSRFAGFHAGTRLARARISVGGAQHCAIAAALV